MSERNNIIIDAEAWRLALLAIKRDILDAEPVEAMRLIDELIDQLDPERDTAEAS